MMELVDTLYKIINQCKIISLTYLLDDFKIVLKNSLMQFLIFQKKKEKWKNQGYGRIEKKWKKEL